MGYRCKDKERKEAKERIYDKKKLSGHLGLVTKGLLKFTDGTNINGFSETQKRVFEI